MEKNDITTKVLIALVSVMIVAVIILGFLLYKTSKENSSLTVTNETTTNERDKIKGEFADLLDQYDNLETSNDSLNFEIEKRKADIETLIDKLNKTRNYTAGMKKQYEAELGSLRNIMRHYVFQIDSLNSLNKELTAENKMVKSENNRIKGEFDEVTERNTELESTIESASVISASHISVIFLNAKDKEIRKASKIEKLKILFTLGANKLAESGQKEIFLRIKRPDGYVISSGKTFNYGDQEISYTDKRTITYNNETIDVSVYHKVSDPLLKGKYNIELYMDGHKIGESSFIIEK